MRSNHQRSFKCIAVRTVAIAILFAVPASSVHQMAVADDRPAAGHVGNDQRSSDSASSALRNAAGSSSAKQQRIEKLIRELGSSRYTERRAAANELRQIGAEAFDLLHAATGDSDPEVAASANYLLRQIDVRWIQPDDSTTVKAVLRPYGQDSEPVRLQRIALLGRLPDSAGVAALCRIARFDRSPIASRRAAIEVIRPSKGAITHGRIDQDFVERELGTSARTAPNWIRQYLAQLRDPAASVAAWKQLVDEEASRLDQNAGETNSEVVSGLMWNLADVYRQLGDRNSLVAVIDRMLALSGDRFDNISIQLLDWLSKNKSWDVVDGFLEKHQTQIEQSKKPLYYAAMARAEQGKKDLAETLAANAASLPAQDARDSWTAAKDLEEHNRFDWAVREYHTSIDGKAVDAIESIPPRVLLANLLHDYEREKEAADLLEPLVKAIQNEGRVGQLYNKLREYLIDSNVEELPENEEAVSRFHFYRASQYIADGDYTAAQQPLKDAIKFDPVNADVLIAMYRLPEADDKWRADIREQISNLAAQFQQKIDEAPSLATNYNQWAWLISNTEGDYQKAVKYSHRSLELNQYGDGVAASYLDTLGRCYYAIGDYDSAAKYERQAIEKVGHMQVMHRQLALFEKSIAEKKNAKPSK